MRRLLLVVAVVVGIGFSHLAWAGVVEPTAVTLSAIPGDKVIQTLRYVNDTSETQSYELRVLGVQFGEAAEDLIFAPLSFERLAWIELETKAFVLEPDEDRQIGVTVNVPEGIGSEVFSLAVIATEQRSDPDGVGVAAGLATLMFVQIGGGLEPNLNIDSFEAVPSDDRELPVRFATLISNAGAGLSEPQIGLVIKNQWGKELEVIALNPTGRRVPGHTHRVFSGEWQGSPWRFGMYTAELYVFPDDSAITVTASTSVVLFTWRTFCLLGVIGLILAGVVYVLSRARHR